MVLHSEFVLLVRHQLAVRGFVVVTVALALCVLLDNSRQSFPGFIIDLRQVNPKVVLIM